MPKRQVKKQTRQKRPYLRVVVTLVVAISIAVFLAFQTNRHDVSSSTSDDSSFATQDSDNRFPASDYSHDCDKYPNGQWCTVKANYDKTTDPARKEVFQKTMDILDKVWRAYTAAQTSQ